MRRVSADDWSPHADTATASPPRSETCSQTSTWTTGPDEVARALHLSTRTMRRRLGEAGTSYQILRDEVRETLAEQMLGTGALSVHDVAIRLGYAESASFIHAFKHWKGVRPRQSQITSHAASAPTSERHAPSSLEIRPSRTPTRGSARSREPSKAAAPSRLVYRDTSPEHFWDPSIDCHAAPGNTAA
ncbi:helix-turn-helix domain-containing protein [Nocardia farcinica]|uniref:helix-turn-helix domain-containing protein n=1 Tax=Nocardia farcinica TaxID=37329 RepID=UPI001B3C5E8C